MICPIPKLIVQNSQPDPGRMGHTWDAAQSSIETASVTAGDRPETELSRSGLENRRVQASSGTGRSLAAVSRVAELWLSGSQPSWFRWLGRLPCNPRTCTR